MSVTHNIAVWENTGGASGWPAVAKIRLTWPPNKKGVVRAEWVPTMFFGATAKEASDLAEAFYQDQMVRDARRAANAEATSERMRKAPGAGRSGRGA